MIIGHAASIGQEVIKLTATSAAVAVSFLGLANTFGRVFWGYVSDRIGRYPALVMIFIVIAAAMVVLPNINTFVPFVLVIMAVGLCFGGILGIFPIVTADLFGLKNLGMNYGVMFSAFAAAAIIGPRLAARVKEVSGDYGQAFMVSAALSIIGAVLTLFVKYRLQKRQAVALNAAKAEN